jgi:hypothetical protein
MKKIDSRPLAALIIGGASLLGVIGCFILLIAQRAQISEVLESQQALGVRLSSETSLLQGRLEAQEAAVAALGEDAATLRRQITDLSRYVSRFAAASGSTEELAAFTEKLTPDLLAPGLYVLAAEDGEKRDEEDSYTVYHITTTVGVGNFERSIQFGAARTGILSLQLYFDYDNDGQVDTDMLSEFVDSIPFGSYVSGALDAGRSQRAYDRFLSSSGRARYSSPQQIDEQTDEVARQLWSFASSTSEQLASWIRSTLPSERSERAEAELVE